MQSLIVLVLIIITSYFMLMETRRNSALNRNHYMEFKSDVVSGNIMQYSDMVTQYLLANYDSFHKDSIMVVNNVEQIKLLDYQIDQIAKYSQKNLILLLNYTSVSFNYASLTIQGNSQPTLYLATSFSGYASGVMGYKEVRMPEVMGATNQLFNSHIYQGNSTSWIIPWLLEVDDKCNVVEVFGQLPNDSSGHSQLAKVKTLFNLFCTQIQAKSEYHFLTYVYVAPIQLPEE